MDIFIFIVILFVVLMFYSRRHKKREDAKALARANAIEDLKQEYPDTLFVSDAEDSYIGIAWENRQVIFGEIHGSPRHHNFAALKSAEVDIDGATVTVTAGSVKTNRGSQIAGAVVGGAVFGGIGVLVGGFTGSKSNNETQTVQTQVQSMSLVCRFTDRQHPIERISFFESPKPLPAKHKDIRGPADDLAYMHGLFATILDENVPAPELPPVKSSIESSATENSNTKVTDDLQKLWSLKEAGALTIEEYSSEKQRLLSRN